MSSINCVFLGEEADPQSGLLICQLVFLVVETEQLVFCIFEYLATAGAVE